MREQGWRRSGGARHRPCVRKAPGVISEWMMMGSMDRGTLALALAIS